MVLFQLLVGWLAIRQILCFACKGLLIAVPIGFRAAICVEIPSSDNVGFPASHYAVELGHHAAQGSQANAYRVSGQGGVWVYWRGSHGSLWAFRTYFI